MPLDDERRPAAAAAAAKPAAGGAIMTIEAPVDEGLAGFGGEAPAIAGAGGAAIQWAPLPAGQPLPPPAAAATALEQLREEEDRLLLCLLLDDRLVTEDNSNWTSIM